MRIFVTGSASRLGRVLLPALCADTRVDAVSGVDIRATDFTHPKFRQRIVDIRAPEIRSAIAGHDALVHLAWVVLRGKMAPASMQAINVGGTRRVFEAAADAQVARLIHLSSAAVYGRGEALPETAPCAPLANFCYAEHKAAIERWMAAALPHALRLRPHIILGPHCQPLLRSILRLPFYVALPDPQPRLQCVHENDVVDAIIVGLFTRGSGPFNLAAEGDFSLRETIRTRHRPAFALPFFVAKTALRGAWRTCGLGGEPAWLDGVRHTLTLDCRRARAELAWAPRYTAQQTLASL